jgi:uncharacterized protein YukE
MSSPNENEFERRGQYEISLTAAAEAVRAFDVKAAEIRAALHKGDAAIEVALATYKGRQAGAFQKVLESIRLEMTNIRGQLENQGQTVHAASGAYHRDDDMVAGTFNRFHGAITSAIG